jgi:hypothetical protein
MDATLETTIETWKRAADALADGGFDHGTAARLAAEIARHGADAQLRHAAAQALPSLRAAATSGADRRTREMAERLFGPIRDGLHALTPPRFGRRDPPDKVYTADECHRRLLGLPLGRRLYGPEIKEAYKQAAKKAHPDMGGSEHAFHELREARDALIKAIVGGNA